MPRTPQRKSHAAAPAAVENARWQSALLVIGLLGLALTLYLSYGAMARQALAFCDAGGGCDLVQASRRGSVFGIPLAFWGVLTYAVLALLAILRGHVLRRYRMAVLVAGVALVYSIYLNIASFIELREWCPYCLVSLALLAAATAALLMWPGAAYASRRTAFVGQTLGIAGVAVIVMQLHYSGLFDPAAGPEDPYLTGLADHLAAIDAKFYGASWCPHCQEQKKKFKGSVSHLPYVECSPFGRNGPPATACVTAEVRSFPTWVINGRRHASVMEIDQLAQLSGYAPRSP